MFFATMLFVDEEVLIYLHHINFTKEDPHCCKIL